MDFINLKNNHLLISALFFFALLELFFLSLGIPAKSFLIYVVVATLITYIPGALFCHGLKLQCDGIEKTTLEFAGGYFLTTLLYFLCLLIKQELIYFFIIALCLAYYLFLTFKGRIRLPAKTFKNERFTYLALALFALILGFGGWFRFFSWLPTSGGEIRLAALMSRDDVFHLSLIRELSHSFPPKYFFAGEFDFFYHIFPDLYLSIFARFFNLKAADLSMRFIVFPELLMWVFSIYILSKKLYDNRGVALLSVFFINFIGNLGFLQPFLNSTGQRYWELKFLPTILPAQATSGYFAYTCLFLGLFSLLNYQKSEEKIWLALGVFFFGALPFYYPFTLLHVFIGLTVPATVVFWRQRKKDLLLATVLLGLWGLAWLIMIKRYSPFQGQVFAFNPWYLVYSSLVATNIYFANLKTTYLKFHQMMFQSGLSGFFKYFIGFGLFYYFCALGIRIMALPAVFRDLKNVLSSPVRSVIAYMTAFGFLISALLTLPPDHYNIAAFLILPVYLLLFPTGKSVYDLFRKKNVLISSLLVTGIFLSLLTTIDLAIKRPSQDISGDQVRLSAFLAETAAPGAILVHPMNVRRYILFPALADVRSFVENVFPVEVIIGRKNKAQLVECNKKIYQSFDPKILRDIFDSHRIDYVLEDRKNFIKVKKSGLLKEIYRKDGFILNALASNAFNP